MTCHSASEIFTSNSSTYTGLRNIAGKNPYVKTAVTQPVFYESAAGLSQTGCSKNNVNTLLTLEKGNCNLSETFAIGGNVNYDLENGSLSYIFGYRHLDQGYINEYNASAVNKYAGYILVDNAIHEQHSHELKLNYSLGDTIDLVTGLFYLKETSDDRQTSFSGGTTAFRPIQDALYKHPAVAVAAVVARPDEKWGETPCAFIELRPGMTATAEELIAWCKQHLAGYKVPRHVMFEELPKTSTGKIQKHVLRGKAKGG